MAEMIARRPIRAAGGVRLAVICLICLALLVSALALLPGLLSWSGYRGAIARFAAGELGRPVGIDGQITVALLPSPILVAGQVRIGDPGDGVAISAPALRLRLAFWPLLLGRVVPRDLVLSHPDITLPWPLPPAALTGGRPDWLRASSARIEHGRLTVGALTFTDMDADLAANEAETGGLAVAGQARLLGQAWRFIDRLGTADAEGATPFEVTLDAAPDGTPDSGPDPAAPGAGPQAQAASGLHLVGTLAADGALSGHVSAHADDLSRLMPAPAMSASADGTVALGRFRPRADLALLLQGVPIAAQLRPAPKGEAEPEILSLSAGRLDLDAWARALGRRRGARAPPMLGLPWPVTLDLAADAIQLHGGLVREVHGRLDVDGVAGTLHDASALLPGDARLVVGGRLLAAQGAQPGVSLSGDVTIDAPQLRATLRWLTACGLRLGQLPPDVLRDAHLAGHIDLHPGHVGLSGLRGTVEQSDVSGRAGVDTATGAIDADLTLDRLAGDNWLAARAPDWPALSQALSATALALKLHVGTMALRGATIDGLVLDAVTNAGGLAVNNAAFDVDGLHGQLAGTVRGNGQVIGGRLDLDAAQAGALALHLPAWARLSDALWSGPVRLHAEATGPQEALIASLSVDLADARLEAHPTIDLGHGSWSTQLTLRHPGAPRLLGVLGLPAAGDWLGEGSLSLLAQLSGAGGQIKVGSFDLTAATLHATGALLLAGLDGQPALSGRVAASRMPFPGFAPHRSAPIALGWLQGWSARLALTASRVALGDSDILQNAQATLGLTGGVLTLDGLTAGLRDAEAQAGTLSASARLESGANPPRLSLKAAIADAQLADPLLGTAIDLAAGRVNASVALTAEGYSPAALLASLGGEARLEAAAGSVSGIDLEAAHQAARDPQGAAALAAALKGGLSRFDTLVAEATIADGAATLTRFTLAGADGSAQASGRVDLRDGSMTVLAHLPDALDLRLSGPIADPGRLAEPGPT